MSNSNQVFNNSDLAILKAPKTLEQLTLIKLIEINHKCLSEIPYCNILKKYDWNDISKNITLSEAFMERFEDEVIWKLISKYQKYSNEFAMKYYLKLGFKEDKFKADEEYYEQQERYENKYYEQQEIYENDFEAEFYFGDDD